MRERERKFDNCTYIPWMRKIKLDPSRPQFSFRKFFLLFSQWKKGCVVVVLFKFLVPFRKIYLIFPLTLFLKIEVFLSWFIYLLLQNLFWDKIFLNFSWDPFHLLSFIFTYFYDYWFSLGSVISFVLFFCKYSLFICYWM